MEFSRQKDEWKATREILADDRLVAAWRKGKREVETGKTGGWEAVKQRLFDSKGRPLGNKP
jgi:hypothetical protein